MPIPVITFKKKYPELYEYFCGMPLWGDSRVITGYNKISQSSLSFYEYISQNEHLHEEWIMKIKLKLL